MEREHIDLSKDRISERKERPILFCSECQKEVKMYVLDAALGINPFQMVFADHSKDAFLICPDCYALFSLDDGRLSDRFLQDPENRTEEVKDKLHFMYHIPLK